jgi:Cytidylate kinase-like family
MHRLGETNKRGCGMPVITIRGQLGSGAPEIGRLIAYVLRIDYVDQETTARVAELLDRGEHDVMAKEMPPSGIMGRISEAWEHVPPLSASPSSTDMHLSPCLPNWEKPIGDTSYLAGLHSVVRQLSRGKSVVIRGRGSQFILRDIPDAFHVLVVAPLDIRVKRVMESLKVNEKSAKREIAAFDGRRREFIKRYFRTELEDPINYDLVINTAHLDFETAAAIVINALPLEDRSTCEPVGGG